MFSVACRDANCSHHGVCLHGKCQCFHGYTNDDCSVLVQSECDNRCSGHGQYVNYPKSMCICEANWTGADCSESKLINGQEICKNIVCSEMPSGLWKSGKMYWWKERSMSMRWRMDRKQMWKTTLSKSLQAMRWSRRMYLSDWIHWTILSNRYDETEKISFEKKTAKFFMNFRNVSE